MKSGRKRFNAFLIAMSFLAPSLIGLLLFVLGPMLASIVFSLNNWNILSPMKFVGLGNYQKLLSDSLWWTSLVNTVVYSLLNIPLVIAVSLVFALIVNRKGRLNTTVFKVMFFMPVVVSEVAASIIWKWLLSTNYGLLNAALAVVGVAHVGWLSDSRVAMLSVVLVVVWRWAGYYMVIMSAALHEIPTELYESASLDGVGGIGRFFYIALPLLAPIIFFVAMMCVIGSFQAFDIIYTLTQGGPGTSTYLTGYYLYQTSFQFLKMGYASSMAILLFVILLLLTVLQLRISRASNAGA